MVAWLMASHMKDARVPCSENHAHEDHALLVTETPEDCRHSFRLILFNYAMNIVVLPKAPFKTTSTMVEVVCRH